MNRARQVFWLFVLCLAAVGANVALYLCHARLPPPRHGALLGAAMDPSRIVVERQGAKPTVLAKTDVWRLKEPYAASVDEQVVLRLVDALLFSSAEDAISEGELLKLGRTRADFRLDDPPLRVTLQDGADAVTMGFGDRTPSSNGVYVVVSGSDSVFILPASVLTAVDVQAAAFRQRSLFPYGPESVRAFDVKRPNGSLLSFVRVGEGWQAGDEAASAAKVGDLLARVTGAQALDFVWPVGATNESESASTALLSGYGLDPESAVTVVLKCVDGVDRRISFGNAAGEKRVYALVQNGSAVVTLDSALKADSAQEAALFTDLRLFPFEAGAVKSYTVSDGGTDYVVARTTEGGWRLEAPVVAAADAVAAGDILQHVLSLSAADVTTEGLKVSVTTNAVPVTVPPRKVLGERRLADLRSKEVLKIEPTRIKRLVSAPRKGAGKPSAVVYSRDRNAWNVESATGGGQVSEAGVGRVLAAINPLWAVRVVSLKATAADLARYGLDEPFYTVAIDPEAEGAVRRNILIGGKTSGGRFATVGSAEAIFVLSAADVGRITSSLIEN